MESRAESRAPFPLRDGSVAIDRWTAERVERIRPWLRPDAEWKEWDTPHVPGPDAAAAEAFATGLAEHPWQPDPYTGRPQRLCVLSHDTAVGLVTWQWEDESSGWRRIGIVLYDPATWGAGIGTIALRLWSDWLVALPDTRRLDLVTGSTNIRMLRAARRCGFTDEARPRGATVVLTRPLDRAHWR